MSDKTEYHQAWDALQLAKQQHKNALAGKDSSAISTALINLETAQTRFHQAVKNDLLPNGWIEVDDGIFVPPAKTLQ